MNDNNTPNPPDEEFSADVIPFDRGRKDAAKVTPTKAQEERLRTLQMSHIFKFYDVVGDHLVSAEGVLNIGPDFAAVVDAGGNIKLVVQASSYSYVRNAGPVASIVMIQPDGGTTMIGSDGGTSIIDMNDNDPGPEVA